MIYNRITTYLQGYCDSVKYRMGLADILLTFKGSHRLDKSAVEEVIVPAILQMIINEKLR